MVMAYATVLSEMLDSRVCGGSKISKFRKFRKFRKKSGLPCTTVIPRLTCPMIYWKISSDRKQQASDLFLEEGWEIGHIAGALRV
jgi:hypothetical protein